MSDQKNTQDLATRLRALADADLTDYAGLNKEKVKQLRDGAREAADFLEGVAIGQNTLTDQIADLCKERDDLKAELAEAKGNVLAFQEGAEAWQERADKAEAEAAALREAGNALVPFLPDISYGIAAKHSSHQQAVMAFKAALSQPGPGAAYQERHEKLKSWCEYLEKGPMTDEFRERVRKLEAVAEVAAEVAYGDGLKEHIGDKLHKAIAALEKKD